MSGTAAVIGAGVAGLTAAIGLARNGWDVRVLERGDGVVTHGAALGLWPPAQRGLEALGVMRRLAVEAVPYRYGVVRDVNGRRLADLPLARIERTSGRPVVLVGRPALMEALLAEAEASGVPVKTGERAAVEDLVADGMDLVVGADGIRSDTRRFVVPDGPLPRRTGATAWRGTCAGTLDPRVEPHGEIWGRGLFAGVTSGGPGRTNWYVAVSEREAVDDLDALRRKVQDWPAPLTSVLDRTEPAHVLTHEIHDLPPLPTYVRGRVALAGDAAHAMTPSLGQGACQALTDGLVLAESLRDAADVSAGLARYDALRRPVGTRFVRGSRSLMRVQLTRRAGLRDAVLHGLAPLMR